MEGLKRALFVATLVFWAGEVCAEQGVITARSVNVRSSPAIEASNVIGRLIAGQTIEVLEHREGWLQVRKESLVGWVRQEYVGAHAPTVSPSPLPQSTPAAELEPSPGPAGLPPERATDLPDVLQSRGVVLRPRVNVRSRPVLDPSSVKFTLVQGQRIEVLKVQDYWYNIHTPDGREGWVIAPMVSLGVGLIRPETYLGGAQALVEAGCRRVGTQLEIPSKAAVLEGAQLLEKWVEVYPDSSHTGRAYYYLGLARAALAKLHNVHRDEDAKTYVDTHPALFRTLPNKGQTLYDGSDFESVLRSFPQSSVAPAALLERAIVRRQQVCSSADRCNFTATLEVFRDVFDGRATVKGKETGVEILLEDLRETAGIRTNERPVLKKSVDSFLGIVTGMTHLELRKEALRKIASAYQALNYPEDAKRTLRLIGPSS
ncbi:MAG: SH3 domain-containing protein [Nitrospirae bacterium]|nr:SH3 domain-containing protein [Nitrospirota bacterium]